MSQTVISRAQTLPAQRSVNLLAVDALQMGIDAGTAACFARYCCVGSSVAD